MQLTVATDLAERLEDLWRALGKPTWRRIAKRAGVHPQQLKQWRLPDGQRPPLRRLETWAQREGWPVGIFAEGGPMPSDVVYPDEEIRLERDDEIAPDEQQFRDFLRNIERTARAIVGDPTLWSAEEHRINQLGVVRAIMRKAADVGRPIPDWLPKIYNELVSGSFS